MLNETGNKSVKSRGRRAIGSKKQAVTEFLIAHPEATNDEIAAKYGVSEHTVRRARQAAVDQQLVSPSYFDRRSAAGLKQGDRGDFGASDLVTTIQSQERKAKPGTAQLTTEETLLMLSELAREAKRDGANKLSIDANVAFHRLKSQSKEAVLGPGPPLTHEDKVERCSRVLEAAGLRAARYAWQLAFPGKGLEHGETTPLEPVLASDAG